MSDVYVSVPDVPDLECTCNGEFRYRGKRKKPFFCHLVNGKKATARIQFMIDKKTHYYQAAKLVAKTWKADYYDGCSITYKDGDIHNIKSDNLVITDDKGYWKYMQRNSGFKGATLEQRKRKLELVIEETSLTLHYLRTKELDGIHKHVTEYLYKCLIDYCINTLHIGELHSMNIVCDCIARMYECIINGMCLYNYERYCKRLLLNYKKKGSFGLEGRVPKPIEIIVEHLNLDCLWERYKVLRTKAK